MSEPDDLLKRAALRIFRAVTADEEAAWETMSGEERDDALHWARQALDALLGEEPLVGLADLAPPVMAKGLQVRDKNGALVANCADPETARNVADIISRQAGFIPLYRTTPAQPQ